MVSVRVIGRTATPVVWVLDGTDEVGGVLEVMVACPLVLGTRWVA